MYPGLLSDHFDGVGFKHLSEVEINSATSNQHEFNGINAFVEILGETADKLQFSSSFFWADDDNYDNLQPVSVDCTWSNVRRNQPNRSPEYRLYYSSEANHIVERAQANDVLFVAKHKNANRLLIVLCPSDSTIATNFFSLFSIERATDSATTQRLSQNDSPQLSSLTRSIFANFQIEFDYPDPPNHDELIKTFGKTNFPPGKPNFPRAGEFSEYVRRSYPHADPVSDPDRALHDWMFHEEICYICLEKHFLADILVEGFVDKVRVNTKKFLDLAISTVNRRKSRAGSAFGLHTAAILDANGLRYKANAHTEKVRAADFLFPGEEEYADPGFDDSLLTMLAAKSTCKERWRQILAEAYRIEQKHLLTTDRQVTSSQLSEMENEKVCLVMPEPMMLHYDEAKRSKIMTLHEFLEFVKDKQDRIDLG